MLPYRYVWFISIRFGVIKHKLNSEITNPSRGTDLLHSVLHDSLSMCYGATKLFSEHHGRGSRVFV